MKADLIEATKEEEVVQGIFEAAKNSMGQEITENDNDMLKKLSARLLKMIKYRENMQEYLKERLNVVTPNMATLIGENVGARLISHAGGLINLAKLPASTIQILGAEKALFRALKTKGNTPKYGLIYHSTYIGKAGATTKGRISRSLANKLAMAARIDAFSLKPTTKFGESFKDQIEERMKFFNNGPKPRKNADVMGEVLQELRNEGLYVDKTEETQKVAVEALEAVEEEKPKEEMQE
jgi:nucleolar protein 56